MQQVIDGVLYDTEKLLRLNSIEKVRIYPSDGWGYVFYKAPFGRYISERHDASALFTEPTTLKIVSEKYVKKIMGRFDIEGYRNSFGITNDSEEDSPQILRRLTLWERLTGRCYV